MTEALTRIRQFITEPLYDPDSPWDDNGGSPWEAVFPVLYGTYSQEFDLVALHVLEGIRTRTVQDEQVAHEMLREMLCEQGLCEYGVSPRSCWPVPEFEAELPALIEQWRAWSAAYWRPVR